MMFKHEVGKESVQFSVTKLEEFLSSKTPHFLHYSHYHTSFLEPTTEPSLEHVRLSIWIAGWMYTES